jgi:hypothetical protein
VNIERNIMLVFYFLEGAVAGYRCCICSDAGLPVDEQIKTNKSHAYFHVANKTIVRIVGWQA